MSVQILQGDCRDVLPTLESDSIDCCVTSPPYWGLRDYGVDCQIGLEASPEEFIEQLVAVFREVRRVLKPTGTLWVNMGDGYATGTTASRGSTTTAGDHVPAGWADRSQVVRCGTPHGLKTKDLIGQPWMLAFALRDDGWYLRSEIIWHKPNPMPESVRDRPTKAHEQVFLLSKSPKYFYDADAIATPSQKGSAGSRFDTGKTGIGNSLARAQTGYRDSETTNARTVWTIPTQPFPEAHFATFPQELAKRCIMAGCGLGHSVVLDPFAGSGTVGQVAQDLGHSAVLIEANPAYIAMIERRCAQASLLAGGAA